MVLQLKEIKVNFLHWLPPHADLKVAENGSVIESKLDFGIFGLNWSPVSLQPLACLTQYLTRLSASVHSFQTWLFSSWTEWPGSSDFP